MLMSMPANIQAPNPDRSAVSFNGLSTGAGEVMRTSTSENDADNARFFDENTRELSMSWWMRTDTVSQTPGYAVFCGGTVIGEQVRLIGFQPYAIVSGEDKQGTTFVITNSGGSVQKSDQWQRLYYTNPVEWHHFVMTYEEDAITDMDDSGDQGSLKCYFDGERLTVDTPGAGGETPNYVAGIQQDYNPTGTFSNNRMLSLGGAVSGLRFKCDIYDVALWSEALSPEAVKYLYNEGRPIDYTENQQRYESARHLTYWWTAKYDSDTAESTYSFGRPTHHKYKSKTFDWADLMKDQLNITVADNKINASPWDD